MTIQLHGQVEPLLEHYMGIIEGQMFELSKDWNVSSDQNESIGLFCTVKLYILKLV